MPLNITNITQASEKAKNIATEQYSDDGVTALAADLASPTGTTVIDGGKITTGSVSSNIFAGNVIYNLRTDGVTPADDSDYIMKINLGLGEIHIR